jgi:hypothetical protein
VPSRGALHPFGVPGGEALLRMPGCSLPHATCRMPYTLALLNCCADVEGTALLLSSGRRSCPCGLQLCCKLNRCLRQVYNGGGEGSADLVLDAHVMSASALQEQEGQGESRFLLLLPLLLAPLPCLCSTGWCWGQNLALSACWVLLFIVLCPFLALCVVQTTCS